MKLHLPIHSSRRVCLKEDWGEMFNFIDLFCWVLLSRTLFSVPIGVENEEQMSNQL